MGGGILRQAQGERVWAFVVFTLTLKGEGVCWLVFKYAGETPALLGGAYQTGTGMVN